MKKFIFSLILLTAGFAGFSQCDPAQNGLGISPGVITVGQTADFTFSIYNGGSACTVPANSLQVVLSLPSTLAGAPNYYQFQSIVSPVGGAGTYFTWTYDPVNVVVVGTNFAPIPDGLGEINVTIRVIGINPTSAGGAISNLNIQVLFGTNNIANDVSTAPLVVNNLVAATFGAVDATGKDCIATIHWNSLNEDVNTNFDVEYSPDGHNFIHLATVAGKGIANGSSYEYAYNQNSGTGYYRIKTGNTYSRVLTVNTNCNEPKAIVYPNPVNVNDKLHVDLVNFTGNITGDLIAANGQVISKNVLKNGSNLVSVTGLTQGVYHLRIQDDRHESLTYKIVVVK